MSLWKRITANRPLTWLGHGLIALGGSLLMEWLLPISIEAASVCWLVYYGLREVGDLAKALKGARTVSEPLEYLAHKFEDMQGDMIGPLLVSLTLWVT